VTRDARAQRRLPVLLSVLRQVLGVLVAMLLVGRLLGQPEPATPRAVAGQAAVLVVVLALLAAVHRFGDLGRVRGLLEGLWRGWSVVAVGLVVCVLALSGPAPQGPAVPVRPGWFVTGVVLGVLAEELLFRAVVLPELREVAGARAAVLGQAALFALAHLLNLVSADGQPLAVLSQVAYTFCLGVALGAVRLATGSLWAPVVLHVLFNLLGDAAALRHGVPVGGSGTDLAPGAALLLVALGLPMLLQGWRLTRRATPVRRAVSAA